MVPQSLPSLWQRSSSLSRDRHSESKPKRVYSVYQNVRVGMCQIEIGKTRETQARLRGRVQRPTTVSLGDSRVVFGSFFSRRKKNAHLERISKVSCACFHSLSLSLSLVMPIREARYVWWCVARTSATAFQLSLSLPLSLSSQKRPRARRRAFAFRQRHKGGGLVLFLKVVSPNAGKYPELESGGQRAAALAASLDLARPLEGPLLEF